MRKKIYILLTVIVLVGIAISAAVSSMTPARQLGINLSSINDDQIIVASVDRFKISRSDVERLIIGQQFMIEVCASGFNMEYPDAKLTNEAALQKIIENKVLYLEAEKKGLIASDQSVTDFIAYLKQAIMNNDSKDAAILFDYINGQGLTPDTYLDSGFSVYKEQLSIGNLRAVTVKGITDFNENIAKWSQAKSELLQQYQSKISLVK